MASKSAPDGRRTTRQSEGNVLRPPTAGDVDEVLKKGIKVEPGEEQHKDVPQIGGDDGKLGKSDSDVPTTRRAIRTRQRGALGAARKQWPRRRLTRAAVAAKKTKRGGRGEPPNVALDMLAEVASATLKSDPTIKTRSPNGKGKLLLSPAQKKLQLSAEHLNLDQIRSLSDKHLVTTFAELTADEIRRNYSYRCFLIPDKCQQRYSSFGNENKARLHMRNHLLGHIVDLLAEASKLGKSARNKFVAETVASRKRKQEIKLLASARRTKVVRRTLVMPSASEGGSIKPHRYTQIRPTILQAPKQRAGNKPTLLQVRIPAKSSSHYARATSPAVTSDEIAEDEELPLELQPPPTEEVATQHIVIEAVDEAWKPEDMEVSVVQGYGVEETTTTGIVVQPHHDHCYTSLEGRRATPEIYYWDGDQEDVANVDVQQEEEVYAVEDAVSFIPLEEAAGTPQAMTEPSSSTYDPIVAEPQFQPHTPLLLRRPKVTRLRAPKQDEDLVWKLIEGEVQQDPDTLLKESPEWERLTALQYIRQLRTKKKDQRQELTCRICTDKKFTAQATLMYHYRSHAGIKPFVCTICDTTFTRQHSLNYHMLIHNNKSRFTCQECGREFRHPSHFKEHLRRHTGETPFECADCGIRFKTRNTYKRHLKTRHGKLLTVNGIVDLSAEEFNRVRTKPKKTPRRSVAPQWPEKALVGASAADQLETASSAVGQNQRETEESEYEVEVREAATVIASHDGAMEEEEGTEDVGQENPEDGAGQVLQLLQTDSSQLHQLGDIIIQAYVIKMDDGTTQIGLCQQPRYSSGAPVVLQGMPLNFKEEEGEGEQQEEGAAEVYGEEEEHESILGLASEQQLQDEEDSAAVTWIDDDGNEVCYDDESAEAGLPLHAVVPCT